jgi:hypothetical protein
MIGTFQVQNCETSQEHLNGIDCCNPNIEIAVIWKDSQWTAAECGASVGAVWKQGPWRCVHNE